MDAPYANRTEAGYALARHLEDLSDEPDLLVLGLPRGGVPVAAELARALGAELDVLVVRKLGAPGHPELAVGAIASGGGRVLNPEVVAAYHLDEQRLAGMEAEEREDLQRQERAYRGDRPFPRVEGRTVILVDDGIATGASMRVAAEALRSLSPARLIIAAPIGPPDAERRLRDTVDQVVLLQTPLSFYAVGQGYDDFPQVSEDDVRRMLEASAAG